MLSITFRALDAYTKALNAAPPLWEDRSMVLGNRAATFMMLERLLYNDVLMIITYAL